MAKETIKTDNSYLADKVGLRVNHLPKKKTITVLDCFAGSGRIWRAVQRRTKKDIRVLAMGKKAIGFQLPGDNLAWLKGMDLIKFDVIDLDAYGVPYEQLKIILDRGYKGTVFVTGIQVFGFTGGGEMPRGLLREIGFTEPIYKKAPSVCNRRGWEYFCEWLAMKGVSQIHHRGHSRKHYFAFSLT